jgi:hypothetical protein
MATSLLGDAVMRLPPSPEGPRRALRFGIDQRDVKVAKLRRGLPLRAARVRPSDRTWKLRKRGCPSQARHEKDSEERPPTRQRWRTHTFEVAAARARYAANPRPANPASIMIQVEGSGTTSSVKFWSGPVPHFHS